MQLLAPAKINLSFQIKGRRPDGFHEIETLMVPVSLYDRISLEKITGRDRTIQFSCNDKSIPAGEDNLVVRAANLFPRQKALLPGEASDSGFRLNRKTGSR